jgi:hypothetical protein
MLALPFLNGIFVLITFLCLWLFYRASGRNKRVLVISVLWLLLQGLVSLTGFYTDYSSMPPRFLLAVTPPLLCILFISFSRKGQIFTDTFDSAWLTYLHAIRIPVEVVLVMLFVEGMVPEIMTFEGRNFDILAGLSAPFVSWFGYVRNKISRPFLLMWNIICVILLLNIVVTAVLSAPLPFQQFGFGQPNIAVFHYPFIWLPAFIVPVVLFSHIVLIRGILSSGPRQISS